jgi:hypothetical protein
MTETTLLETPITPSESSNRPAGVPEKFWDAENGTVRTEALLKSYLELEKKLTGGLPDPATDDGKRALCKMLGCPDSPEDYQIDVSHGYFTVDPALNTKLHALGFTTPQVQEVYNLAAEKLVPMILDMAAEFQADRELERLSEQFGGPEKWTEMSRQLLAFGKKNLQPDVLRALASSFDGVMVLHNMMNDGTGSVFGAGDAAPENGATNLHAMMRDPKYWRDRDPAFIAKVTEGFARMYGDS